MNNNKKNNNNKSKAKQGDLHPFLGAQHVLLHIITTEMIAVTMTAVVALVIRMTV